MSKVQNFLTSIMKLFLVTPAELKLDRLSADLTNLKVMEAISVYRRCFILFFF